MSLFAEKPPLSYEDQHKFDYFFLDALRLKHKGEHTDAFNTLQYALQIDSTSSAALYEISHYYLFLKKEDQALSALKKAVAYSPDNYEYKLALASLTRDLEKNKEAIALYEELISEHPQEPELYYHLSNLYLQQNDPDKAIEALNGLENNMGINEAVSLQKYRLYQSSGKGDEALQVIETLAAKFPTESKFQILLGDFYLESQELDKALSYYEKSAQMDADNPYYFISMSNYYEAKGDGEAAAQEIEKALKNPALDMDTKLGVLGRYIDGLDLESDDRNTVNALFKTLMEQHSQDKELNRMYGQFLLLQGKTEEAKFQLQVVTEALPEDIAAWTQLLKIVVKEGNPDEIIRICDGALVYFPNVPEFYFYKGTACLLKQEYAKALEMYQEGLDVTPIENKMLLSTFAGQMADIHYQLGNREEAFAFYDKSLQYNDRNMVVLNNYAYYLSLAKEHLDKAERMAAAAVKLQSDNATYLDTYAWVFFQQGNYSLAKFYIESAVSKNAQPSGEILEHYGDILYKIGHTDRAVSEWEKALPLREAEGDGTELLKKKIADRMYYE
ncbi:MAG: tetratricopeptide repeat protein [Dysgonamonadaceae bacterium]|jgi:tetratricopeptide (TPR) repeat protein|nr:tetratricopeptide repeat protein [Dysgonamonadaceae bacterium]